ncbi:prepilin-type N-terminal cleavage/methylation domain-containing protein [Halobacillus litoralis]|uniref:PulJ/GspJ family protein n=1 Tax=Halobacillus litoralis TaxID=45668 RepID=UPI001CFEB6E3|nr:prepilin-type N-terminal cleavage/methylation domain-containing protein [Halobacillus litoralis]WLR46115.1 prepilin-type N-terminal cleavage/methylation domain-containing protein [Halobacillus litoralis]
MNIKSEKGMTLVELLAVVSLSMIVMVAAYHAFYFVTGAVETSSTKTEIRKEANILILALEENLINVDSIEVQNDHTTTFQAFTATSTRLDDMDEESTFTYIDETTDVSIQNGHLLIGGIQQNAEGMDLSNTLFELDGNKLTVHLEIFKKDTDETYSLVKIFRLGTE